LFLRLSKKKFVTLTKPFSTQSDFLITHTYLFFPIQLFFSLSLIVSTLLLATAAYTASAQPTLNIVQTAQGNAQLSTLVTLLGNAGLVPALSGPGPFTVFAPNNAAFAKYPIPAITDVTDLTNTLKYHVISGRVFSTDLLPTQTVPTLFGDSIIITKTGSVVTINGYATVTTADVNCTNGVVHIIGTPIETNNMTLAKAASSTGSTGSNALSSLLSLVGTAGLTSSFTSAPSALTLLAPNNAAFVAFQTTNIGSWYTNSKWISTKLAGLLLNHVVGSTVFSSALTNNQVVPTLAGAGSLTVSINGSIVKFLAQNSSSGTVIVADIPSYKGVVHIIDGVLVPNPPTGYPTIDIVATAVATPTLSSLVSAVQSAGLATALSYPNGPFTVFAPNNAAFAKFPVGAITDVTDLKNTLLYHVIPGRFYASNLVATQTVTTLFGDTITIAKNGSVVTINGYATVTLADVDCTNGVVHVIDTVIETNNMTIAKAATSTGSTGSNALSSLLSFVGTAGLTSTFTTASSTYTLLAPINSAFVAFHKTNIGSWYTNAKWVPTQLAGLLKNHVIGSTVFSSALTNGQVVPTLAGAGSLTVSIVGSTVTFSAQKGSSGTVTVADIPSYKGVVHTINGVLIPNAPAQFPTNDIAGNAVATPTLSFLVSLLTNASLVSAVSEPNGPYTVLAPLDSAFNAISSTLAGLSADQVATVLKYHVIKNDINANGRLYSTDLVNGSTYTTLDGYSLTCLIDTTTTPATVSFLSSSGIVAKVTQADVDSSNGVVHIIDTVLIPSGVAPTAAPSATATPKPNGAAAASASFFALILALIAATMSTF
jgi:transforming growth factor-beta-induced protein